jgi:hypothetical protein
VTPRRYFGEPTGDTTVLAEFSLRRVVLLLIGAIVLFVVAYTSPNWNQGLIRNNYDNNPYFWGVLTFGNGLMLLFAVSAFLRVFFLDRRAIYTQQNQLCAVRAFGTTKIDFTNISSFSIRPSVDTVVVHRIKGRGYWLPVPLTDTTSSALIERLEQELKLRRST